MNTNGAYRAPVLALKCKQGELKALLHTDHAVVRQVTPVVELLPSRSDPPQVQNFQNLVACAVALVRSGISVWVDAFWLPHNTVQRRATDGIFGELDRQIDQHLGFDAATKAAPNLIPVVANEVTDGELARLRLLQEHHPRPIGVRIREPRRLALSHTISRLPDIAKQARVALDDVHVLVDEQHVTAVDTKMAADDAAIVRQLRGELALGSVTLLSGWTPSQRRTYSNHVVRFHNRTDHLLWSAVDEMLRDKDGTGIRYGDYGVVHPIPPQGIPLQPPKPYFYYTTSDQSLFLARRPGKDVRGEVTIAAREDAFAELVDDLTEHERFAGPDYSWGDSQLVHYTTAGPRRTAESKDWLAMATSHHLTHLVDSARR